MALERFGKERLLRRLVTTVLALGFLLLPNEVIPAGASILYGAPTREVHTHSRRRHPEGVCRTQRHH